MILIDNIFNVKNKEIIFIYWDEYILDKISAFLIKDNIFYLINIVFLIIKKDYYYICTNINLRNNNFILNTIMS